MKMSVSASWGGFALLSTCVCVHAGTTSMPIWQDPVNDRHEATQQLLLRMYPKLDSYSNHIPGGWTNQSLDTSYVNSGFPRNLIDSLPRPPDYDTNYSVISQPGKPNTNLTWDTLTTAPRPDWKSLVPRLSLNSSDFAPQYDNRARNWTGIDSRQHLRREFDYLEPGSGGGRLWMNFQINSTSVSYSSTRVPKHGSVGKYGRNSRRQIASKQARDKASIIFGLILIPFFSVFGLVGNVMSLRVLSLMRSPMRKVINLVLVALAVSDLTFLLHAFFFSFLKLYSLRDPVAGAELRAITFPFLGAYSSVVTARITTGLTVMLSLERLVAVYFPMRARILCSRTVTIAGIALVYGVTILVFFPFLLKYRADRRITFDNRTVHKVEPTSLGKDPKFFPVYGTVLNTLFRFVPLVLLMVANVLIASAIRRRTWQPRRTISSTASGSYRTRGGLTCAGSARSSVGARGGGGGENSTRNGSSAEYTRHHFRNSSFEQRRITLMLLAVSLVSLVCIMPGSVHFILEKAWAPAYSRMGGQSNLYVILITVSYWLETVNSSVNFIIYMAFSAKFKRTYQNILCCRKIQDADGGGSARSVVHFSNRRGCHNGNHNGRHSTEWRRAVGTGAGSSSSSHSHSNRDSYLLHHYQG